VVTSPTGAAIHDFLRILRRRNFGGEVVIFPARVQGKGSSEDVQSMLQHAAASKGFDLVVLTRGGGSIEDLWTFNEEAVAQSVAACPIPVISAIGHEIDHVLTDYAADKRAETPSGAAELITSLYLDARRRYESAHQDITEWIEAYLSESRACLHDFNSRMRIIAPKRRVQHHSMRLDDLESRISRMLFKRISTGQQSLGRFAQRITEQHPKTRIRLAQQHVEASSRRLQRAIKQDTTRLEEQLRNLQQRLDSGSLQATLKRGFAVIKSKDGRIMERAEVADKEERLNARFYDGEISLKKDTQSKATS
jgi:exodeoxyribonuclease VII large subunit